MKYIITPNGTPILFSETETHATVARGIGAESAGFVRIHWPETGEEGIIVECYGFSFTLGLNSRPEEDSKIIHQFLTQ